MSIVIEQSSGSELLFNHGKILNSICAGIAISFFLGPIVGVCCAVASPILSALASREQKPWISLNKQAFEEIKMQCSTYGLRLLKVQTVYGLFFYSMGITINQVAIHWIKENLGTVQKAIYCFFRVSIMAPILEEVAFRGFLQDKIHDVQSIIFGSKEASSRVHTIIRVALVAIAFALCHYHALQGATNALILISTGIMGFIFGMIKESNQTLWSSTTLHSLINTSVTARIWVFGA